MPSPKPVDPPPPRARALRSAPPAPPPPYWPALDGLRGVAVLLVLLHHLQLRGAPLLRLLADHGWVGVDLFFALSGLLITGLLRAERARRGALDLRAFWLRRLVRLGPGFLVALALTALFLLRLAARRHDAALRAQVLAHLPDYLLQYGNYSKLWYGDLHFLSRHLWSLAVEEHCYLLWPPLLALLLPRGRRLLLALCGLGLVLAPLLRLRHAAAAAALPEGRDHFTILFATHCRYDAVLWGCLLALSPATPAPDGGPRLSRRRELLVLAAALALWALALSGLHGGGRHPRLPVAYFSLGFTLVGAGAALVLWAARRGRLLPAALRRAPLVALGRWSYEIYLLHLLAFEAALTLRARADLRRLSPSAHALLSVGLAVLVGAALHAALARLQAPLRARLRR